MLRYQIAGVEDPGQAIQQAFFDTISGRLEDKHGWLEFVYEGEPRQAAAAGARSTRA